MFNFYKNRNTFYIISIAIFAVCTIGLFINGLKLDIQFVGGAIYTYSYEGDINTSDATKVAKDLLKREVNVSTSSSADGSKTVRFDIAGNDGINAQTEATLTDELTKSFPDNKLDRQDIRTVDPFIGKEFLTRGAIAIILASLLIVLYVWYRFRKINSLSLGIFGLVALLHDALIVLCVFILFKIPLNDAFVAVVLTIIGYSINDTIVIYDRIRENSRIMKANTPVDELVNTSIHQSLTRSIFTSLSTFVAITSIFILAAIYDIQSIKNFALPLMVGVISGTYSTIFIAGPLWASWELRKNKKVAK